MKLPSKRLKITAADLQIIAQNVAMESVRRSKGFEQRLAREANLAGQNAIVERLDGLLEIAEHILVHHLQKNPPQQTMTIDEIDVDDLIKGELSDDETQPDA